MEVIVQINISDRKRNACKLIKRPNKVNKLSTNGKPVIKL